MIEDPRWYECFMAALTGASSQSKEAAPLVVERAILIAEVAYEELVKREAQLAAQKTTEVKKGQIWRFKEDGRIRVVKEVKNDAVLWRHSEHGSDAPAQVKRLLESQDCYLIGQEPDVAQSEGEQST